MVLRDNQKGIGVFSYEHARSIYYRGAWHITPNLSQTLTRPYTGRHGDRFLCIFLLVLIRVLL